MSFSPARDADPDARDTIPSSPPPEVLEAMDAAAQAYDRLAGAGRTLRFSPHRETGRLSVQLADRAGNVLRTVSPTAVLHVAAGGGLG